MFKIYYLRFTQYAIDNLPFSKRLFNEHFVLNLNDKFFVMTSKPIQGLKSTFIHSPNIEGQIYKKQFVIEHLHIYNPNLHIFEFTAKGAAYLVEHQEKFAPVLESLKNIQII